MGSKGGAFAFTSAEATFDALEQSSMRRSAQHADGGDDDDDDIIAVTRVTHGKRGSRSRWPRSSAWPGAGTGVGTGTGSWMEASPVRSLGDTDGYVYV